MPRIVKRQGNGSATDSLAKIDVKDNGVALSTEEVSIHSIDFIGDGIKVMTDGAGVAYVMGPNEDFASGFNENDGQTDGRMEYTINPVVRFISQPDLEGDPFYTGGFGGSLDFATNIGSMTISTREQVTDITDSTLLVQMLHPNGDIISQYRTPPITSNMSMSSNDSHLNVVISLFEKDVFKTKAKISITIDYASILLDAGKQSGKFDIRIVQELPGGLGERVFLLSESGYLNDFFYDGTGVIPSFSGDSGIQELNGSVKTKHISGIEYYVLDSGFDVAFSGLDGINNATALPNNNVLLNANDFGVSSFYASPITGSPSAADFTGWSAGYDVNGVSYLKSVFINKANFRFVGAGVFSATAIDSWNMASNIISAPPQNILVDTVSIESTGLSEYFNTETYRADENYDTNAWDSSAELREDIGYAFAKINIIDNFELSNGDNVCLNLDSGLVEIVLGTDVQIGDTASDTIANLALYINGLNDGVTATQRVDNTSVLDLVKTSPGPSGNAENTCSQSSFNMTVSNFEGGTNDGMIYYGSFMSPSASKLTSGIANSDWSTYSPNIGGLNPNYSGKTVPCSYFRYFNDTSGMSRTSMNIQFAGNFPSGVVNHLESGDIKIYVRKKDSLTVGGLSGVNAPVMKVHGHTFSHFGYFDQGVTDEGSYIREGGSSGNIVNVTFGTFTCLGGVYMEVVICRDDISIDTMIVTFF